MNISNNTFQKYEVNVTENSRIYPVYKEGIVVAYKLFQLNPRLFRMKSLEGPSVLPINSEFFGQQLFKTGGKDLILTCSETECLKVYESLNGEIPVVSSFFGIVGFQKQVIGNKEFLDSFKNVYLLYLEEDQEEMKELFPEFKHIVLNSL